MTFEQSSKFTELLIKHGLKSHLLNNLKSSNIPFEYYCKNIPWQEAFTSSCITKHVDKRKKNEVINELCSNANNEWLEYGQINYAKGFEDAWPLC